MLRLGDGGVRSGVGSFDLARDSIVGRKSAAARKNTYLSSTLRQLVGPSVHQGGHQGSRGAAARTLRGARRHVPQQQGAALPLLRALVAIVLFGALEVAVELLVAGDSDRRRGRSKLQGQRKLER